MGAGAIAFTDLAGSLRGLPLAFTLALDDIRAKYRRTALGPLWIVLGQVATIIGFVIVFSGLFGMDPGIYTLYLAAGIPVWTLISLYLTDMPNTFIISKAFIESYELPWLIQVWRRSIGYVLQFFHQVLPLFAAMAFLRVPPTLNMLYVFPGLAIVMLAGSGIGMLLSMFGARYRDMQHAMTVIAGFLFMFSPVMWRAEQLHVNEWAVRFNPFYYLIELLRNPLLGIAPAPMDWVWAIVAAVSLFIVGFVAFAASRPRLYHWL